MEQALGEAKKGAVPKAFGIWARGIYELNVSTGSRSISGACAVIFSHFSEAGDFL
jgi:hypothetical protein